LRKISPIHPEREPFRRTVEGLIWRAIEDKTMKILSNSSDELSEPEKKAIDKCIADADADAGNLHSNSEATQLVQEWLKK
jgi:hypothetical protein